MVDPDNGTTFSGVLTLLILENGLGELGPVTHAEYQRVLTLLILENGLGDGDIQQEWSFYLMS